MTVLCSFTFQRLNNQRREWVRPDTETDIMALMQRFWRRISIGLAAISCMTAGAVQAHDAVLAVESLDAIIDKVEYLAKAILPEHELNEAIPQLESLLDDDALPGLDRKRPLGVFASLPKQAGGPPTIAAAIPITDVDDFLDTLRQFGVQAERVADVPGFTHRVTIEAGMPMTLFLTASRDYAFLTPVPADAPALRQTKAEDWLPNRADAGDVSLTVRIDQCPKEVADVMIRQIEQDATRNSERQPDEDEAQYRGRVLGQRLVLDAVVRIIRDGEILTLDFTIDRDAGTISLVNRLAAKRGTPMAAALSGFDSLRSRFSSLAPDAPLAAWMALPLSRDIRDLLWESFEQGAKGTNLIDGEQRRQMNEMLRIVRLMIQQEVQDVGVALLGPSGRDGTYAVAMGMGTVEGRKAEALIKRIAATEKDDAFEADAARSQDGVPIHRITVPLDGSVPEIYGDASTWLAFRDDAVAIGFGAADGRKAVERGLTAAAARGDSDTPIAVTMKIAGLAPLTKGDGDAAVDTAAEVFRGANAGKDKIRLTVGGRRGDLRTTFSLDVPTLTFFSQLGRQTVLAAEASGN